MQHQDAMRMTEGSIPGRSFDSRLRSFWETCFSSSITRQTL